MTVVQGRKVVFHEPVAQLHVQLRHPTQPGTLLAVAFVIRGDTFTPTVERITDTLGGTNRWRRANDTLQPGGERRSVWYRLGSHPGNREVVAETANALLVRGVAVAIETAGISAGEAVQELADLL